jgi:hypothetical protein
VATTVGKGIVDQGVVERATYEAQNAAFYEQYKAGTLDIHEFLGFALRPLAEHEPQDLARWHAAFMRERIAPLIGDKARRLVAGHLEAGDLCAIITATNSFVTAPIAREFGVEHLIATEPEAHDGRFTGRVAGTPARSASASASRSGSSRRSAPATVLVPSGLKAASHPAASSELHWTWSCACPWPSVRERTTTWETSRTAGPL